VSVLRASGLHVARGGREVLAGVDLELSAGEIVELIGPARAGKSTLLAALAGLLPVAAGTIERRGTIALAMQSADLPRATPSACLQLALVQARVPPHEHAPRIEAALAALHVPDRPVAYLGPAERRRVHIARALALRADVVLLDEPFAALGATERSGLIADTREVLRTAIVAGGEPTGIGDRLIAL
jgi:ABC-type nitrate/sulfonate/bicarbonate transport system ATPase subunit